MINELQKEAEKRLSRLRATLEREHGPVFASLAPAHYAEAYLERNDSHKYHYRSPRLLEFEARVRATDPAALPRYNRYLLLHHFRAFSPAAGSCRLPPSVLPLYDRELNRILTQIEGLDDNYWDLSADLFLKDMAILSHRLIPVGAEFAQPGSGIPRHLLVSGGVKQFLRGSMFVLFQCRGFRPFFELHTHILSLDDFHEEGWMETYHRLANLLEVNPSVRGWLSASWFLDPALSTISPRLAHLRNLPIGGGAKLMFVKWDTEGCSGALVRSNKRQRLFKEGRYVPAICMRIWHRRAVIRWSQSEKVKPMANKRH